MSIGFCGLLTIVFVTLKLMGYIGWSWLLVMAPLWIPLCFWILLMVLIGIGFVSIGKVFGL